MRRFIALQWRHNLFSKVDHDKVFVDKNYRGPKNDAPRELPALRMDIRKRLASTHLSAKLSDKTPVITVATGLGVDGNAGGDQVGDDSVVFDDDNASVMSNHSHGLDEVKKSPEQIQMEDFMDELGKVGHHIISEEESDGSYDSDDSLGDLVERDRKKYHSTLDVHKKFMLKARKKNAQADVKTVAAMKVMCHKKKLAKLAQDQELIRPNTAGNNKDTSEMTPNKSTNSASGTPNAAFGLPSVAQSFMFLSKLSNGGRPSKVSSPATSVTNSPQLLRHKSVSMASDVLSPPPSDSSPGTIGSPKYTASPGGYAYSSKHNLLHDPSLIGSGPNSPLPLFGKAQRKKPLGHNHALSATTLRTLNSKYDTTNSVLSAARDSAAMVKVTGHVGEAMGGSPDSKAGVKSLYHVPELKAVTGKKSLLNHLDKMFNAFTHQTVEAPPRPATPPPAAPMTLETLFSDQLIKAEIPEHEKITDEELNTLLNSTHGPENYGPRIVPERHTPAAIVAELDRQLEKQRKAEAAQKRVHEAAQKAAAAAPYSPVPVASGYMNDQASVTEDYSMATFVTRLEQHSQDFASAKQAGLQSDGPNGSPFIAPPKLDLSKVGTPKQGLKVNHIKDSYSIDVHSLRLPDILSPPSDAYMQAQKAPILCIYSPPPLVASPPQTRGKSLSPEAPRNISPDAAAVGRGSPIQLQGTLTASLGGHAASSPAIMYIASPGLPSSSSAYNVHSHNKSSASLPIVISPQPTGSGEGDKRLHHQYQSFREYQKSLHPQTRDFVNTVLASDDPDLHTDPRNYRNSTDSIPDIDESIYDFEAEYEDLTAPPRGDPGAVLVDTESNRATLPSSVMNHGGEALLALGYQYQHSTNTFVHKDERNRSRFGQYERSSPVADPLAGDFSDRHLQSIRDTTTGEGATPVVFIPPGAPAAEPALDRQTKSAVLPLSNASTVTTTSAAAKQFAHDPTHVNRKGKTALSPREVLMAPSYAPVRATMQYPHEVPLNAIHYRGAGVSGDQFEDSDDEGEAEGPYGRGGPMKGSRSSNVYDNAQRNAQQGAGHRPRDGLRSSDSSTVLTHPNPGAEIKQEICAYTEKLATQTRAERHAGAHVTGGASVFSDPTHSLSGASGATGVASHRQAERARVKLWDKLNNRYGGDREGDFVRQRAIKDYVYEGVKADTQIMRDYLAELDEGWVV